jgi:hypothetical protein
MLFVLLERTINNDSFKGKICINLSKDPPSNEFNGVLKEWISRSNDGNPQIGLVHLESYSRVDPLLELNSLKDAMDDFSRNVDFMNIKFGKIFAIFSTTNFLTKDPDVCSQTDWKSVFLSLLSMKVSSKVIVCTRNQKYFYNFVVAFQKDNFIDEISMEYGFY